MFTCENIDVVEQLETRYSWLSVTSTYSKHHDRQESGAKERQQFSISRPAESVLRSKFLSHVFIVRSNHALLLPLLPPWKFCTSSVCVAHLQLPSFEYCTASSAASSQLPVIYFILHLFLLSVHLFAVLHALANHLFYFFVLSVFLFPHSFIASLHLPLAASWLPLAIDFLQHPDM